MKIAYCLMLILILGCNESDYDPAVYSVHELTNPNSDNHLYIIRKSRGLSYLVYYVSPSSDYCRFDTNKCLKYDSDITKVYYKYSGDTVYIYGTRFTGTSNVIGAYNVVSIPLTSTERILYDSASGLNYISFLGNLQNKQCR
jgi:hypothetical protein